MARLARLERWESTRRDAPVVVVRITGGLPGAGEFVRLGDGGTLHRGEGEDEAGFAARATGEAAQRGLRFVVIGGLPDRGGATSEA
jgi:hypothetical protein